jgi:hypothetical protein
MIQLIPYEKNGGTARINASSKDARNKVDDTDGKMMGCVLLVTNWEEEIQYRQHEKKYNIDNINRTKRYQPHAKGTALQNTVLGNGKDMVGWLRKWSEKSIEWKEWETREKEYG